MCELFGYDYSIFNTITMLLMLNQRYIAIFLNVRYTRCVQIDFLGIFQR